MAFVVPGAMVSIKNVGTERPGDNDDERRRQIRLSIVESGQVHFELTSPLRIPSLWTKSSVIFDNLCSSLND